LTLPFEFSFETGCHDARSIEIFNIFIHPCALPAEFCGGSLNHSTYEYYQPNVMVRQLGCGQMPPRLFLHEFLKPREEIKESIQARRVFEYQCSPTMYTWLFTPITIAHPLFISLLTQNVHLASSTQQAEQAGFTRAKESQDVPVNFP
jgi:hypothetical protein